jgi:hypothetical protein
VEGEGWVEFGEAEGAAAVEFGHEAAAFGAVAIALLIDGALFAGFGGTLAVVDELLDEGFVGFVRGVDFGDGSDGGEGAEFGIEFEVFDDGVDFGGFGVGFGSGGAPEVEGGEVEAVEEEAGAFGVEGVGGDAGEDVGDGVLDDVGVFEARDGEDGVEGVLAEVFGGAAGGVVEVAEVFAAEGGRAAAAACEVDVTAEVARVCVGHDGPSGRRFF